MCDASANQHQTSSEFPWSEFLEKQLAKIASLPPNWDRMEAEAPSPDAIADTRRFLKKLNPTGLDIPKPGIAPTASGGIMLFWEQGAKALEIEFEASGRFGYLFEDEDNSVSTEETLDAEADKQQLLNYLRQMFEDDCVRR